MARCQQHIADVRRGEPIRRWLAHLGVDVFLNGVQMPLRVYEAALAIGLLASASLAYAQPTAHSLEQLQMLVQAGDVVTISDDTRGQVTGRIARLSPSSLTLLIDGEAREFLPGNILSIRQRRSDSLATGAIIGASVGGGLASAALLAVPCEGCGWSDPWMPLAVLGLYAAAGAGIGVGIDALIRPTRVIYAPPGGGPKARVTPLVGHDRKGLALSFRF
jgi:hypothetical protein